MKIVIVGGVAGGASAAARARRLDEHATIVLLQSGPDVSYASCGMPYYIGNEIQDRHVMSVQTPTSLYQRLNIIVHVNTRVTDIHVTQKKVLWKREGDAMHNSGEETYDELVLAVGAEPFLPPIPGLSNNLPGLYALRNLQDMDDIDSWITTKEPNHAIVAGAGFVGLEMVEQLMNRGNNQKGATGGITKVTLVEAAPQILAPLDPEMSILLQREMEQQHGVDGESSVTVITGDAIASLAQDPNDQFGTIVTLQSGRVLPSARLTILGLGVRPDTEMIQKAGIPCTGRGHIIVDDYLHTSVPSVWAVGDAVEVRNPILSSLRRDDTNNVANNSKTQEDRVTWTVPLAGPANRQGRMVADNIFGKKRQYKGTYATSVLRCFEQMAACVGMNERLLQMSKIPYACVHIHPSNHAGYYPGASPIHLKVLFDRDNGKLYGAQAVGKDGVEKRIDVIATAMQGGMRVDELAELELCYAPPVGSAKDPVNYAGMVAQNIMDGLVNQIEWNHVATILDNRAKKTDACQEVQAGAIFNDGIFLLDVRNPGEIASSGKLGPGAYNIPLNSLRDSLDEVPRDQHIVVSCASGQRAYYGCRILMQNGYDKVSNLGGAYLTFHAIHPANT